MLTDQQTKLVLICKLVSHIRIRSGSFVPCSVTVHGRKAITVPWSLSNEGMESHTKY